MGSQSKKCIIIPIVIIIIIIIFIIIIIIIVIIIVISSPCNFDGNDFSMFVRWYIFPGITMNNFEPYPNQL